MTNSDDQFSGIFNDLLRTLHDGVVTDVRIGAFWTAVSVHVDGEPRCGLAASLRPDVHIHGGAPDVPGAGALIGGDGRELAALVHSESVMERAVGLAALNALLPRLKERWTDGNAEEILAERGVGKRVAVVGHFPFVERLRERLGALWVLELEPRGEDLPAAAAPDILPQADVVAVTATTLLNGSFTGLMSLCRADAQVMVLGPSTPLSPVLFDYGVDMASGATVGTAQADIDATLAVVSLGGAFRQVHGAGVRLVTMVREAAHDPA